MEATNDFMKKDLKISDENLRTITVKKAMRLGKAEADKIQPVLVTFSHPSERNLVMFHSKNLRNNRISMKKSVPKQYREEFRKFEDQSFKLRNMPDLSYQTQIVFDGHIMLLRYKLRDTPEDKYHFMTYWQYEPPMVIESGPSSSLRIPPGTKASPPPSADVVAKANSSFFFSVRGLNEDITEDTF